MNTDELRSAAKKRLKAQHDFKQFLAVWGAVSVLLIVIWLLTGAWGYFWPIWPIFVMGIAVLFVGLDAYGPSKHITEDAIDAEVARLVDRQQQRAAARAAAAQPTYEQGQQYTGGQTAAYDPSAYQNGQTGQAPVYDPTQYQRQAGSYETAQFQTGPTAGYGAQASQEQPTQAYTGTQQYGAQEQPSTDTTPAVPAPPRTTEPTPTEQFAAVFSGTGLPSATEHAPSEPAESIVLESTATGDTETVTAAADETQARLDGETPTEHVSTEGSAADGTAVDDSTDRATTSAAAAPAATVSAPRKTMTRSTTPRKPAAKTATTAGTTVRKTSSTRASTGTAAPKATGAKAPATKSTGATGTKRTTAASATDGTPKAATTKAPAKPRTTKPKVTPTEAPTTAAEPGTAE